MGGRCIRPPSRTGARHARLGQIAIQHLLSRPAPSLAVRTSTPAAARYCQDGSYLFDSPTQQDVTYGFAVDRKTKRRRRNEAFRQCCYCDVIKTFRDSCSHRGNGRREVRLGNGRFAEIAERKLSKMRRAECKIPCGVYQLEMITACPGAARP